MRALPANRKLDVEPLISRAADINGRRGAIMRVLFAPKTGDRDRGRHSAYAVDGDHENYGDRKFDYCHVANP